MFRHKRRNNKQKESEKKMTNMWKLGIILTLTACQSAQYREIKRDNPHQANERLEILPPAYRAYPVTVDYNQSLRDMVMAGNYYLMNDTEITITALPSAGRGKVNMNLYLVHLNYSVDNEHAIDTLDRLGFAPAKLEHLLAFGAKYPVKQTEYPIVALGSQMTDPLGRQYVNYLDRIDDVYQYNWPGRCLYMFSRFDARAKWPEDARFLAIRK